ncbi:MAG: YfhO family protein [Fibrobacter sp.]|nr:YfhO family protein [Fibrobacter sp.]
MKIFEKNSVFFGSIAVLFLVILLIVFREFVFNPDLLMLNSDQLNGIGSRILRAENVVMTEWDDSRLGGVPTIDAAFADVYHPLVWVQFLTDPARAVGMKFIATIWVAFISAFLLAWNLTGSRWWGALLGFLYAFSPEYFTYIYGGHDGKMMVFAIAPLALLAIRKVIRTGSLPYLIVLALSIVWMILGSHIQLTYFFLWGAGFYALYEVAFHADGLATKGKRLGLAAIALALGLAMSCFQILPTYIYTTTQSVRGDEAHTNYGHATSWCLHQEELAQMLLPGFVGVDVYTQDEKTNDLTGSSFVNISMEEYRAMASAGSQGSPFYWGHNSFKLDHNNAGALLTFLGFLCLFLPGKRRTAVFWGLGAVLALSYGMGIHSPLFKLWYNILPGAKSFRAPGMALFWLPLLLVMMAAPVVKALADESAEAVKNKKALLHGTVMFIVLLFIAVIARFNWTLFISGFGLVVMVLYAIVALGVMSVDDQGKALNIQNFTNAFKQKLPGTSRAIQVCVIVGFAFIGLFLMSGQKLMSDPVAAPYFKPLNEVVMNVTAGKVIPGFILILAIIAVTWAIFKWKGSVAYKVCILTIAAGVELFFINGAFIQNVPAKQYLQPGNGIVNAIKTPYKADSLNTPRVLSLSQNKAISGNALSQYHLRNAEGFHDNELGTYRAFRGGQNDANYLLNINNPDAAHPFLDLMNIGAIIFDSRQGTTYMPISTAMGEAYLYGSAVVMDDDAAINALRNGFEYREKAILSEAPTNKGSEGAPEGKAKLIASPKMDTQVFAVETDRPSIMVVAGNYHPYWKAYVNGSETKVFKAFGTLRAIEVPKGKSEVRMEYRSQPFHMCLKIAAIATILLIILGIVALRRNKKTTI